MRKLLTFLIALGAIVFAVVSPVAAQSPVLEGFPPGVFQNHAVYDPPSYAGPGDLLSGWFVWGSCARAFSAAYAASGGNACDLVDSAAPTVVICTLKFKPTGFVDLTTASCTGGVTPATKCAAATGGVCNVSQVYDQTGNSRPWTNATAASQPFLVFSGLNSLPVMKCTAASCRVISPGSLSVSFPFTWSVVAERQVTSGVGVVLGAASGNVYIGFGSAANVAGLSNNGGPATVAATDNAWHGIQGLANTGSGSALNVDGTDTSGLTAGGTAITSDNLRIFQGNGIDECTCSIAEVGLLAATTTSTQRGNLFTNQNGSSGYNGAL